MSAGGEGNSVTERRLHILELNETSVKELSKMCWGLLGISKWFGMCKSETKAPGLAQLEPRLWVLVLLVVGWIEEIAATERQTCLLPMPVSLTQPCLATLLGAATTLWLMFHCWSQPHIKTRRIGMKDSVKIVDWWNWHLLSKWMHCYPEAMCT